MKACYHPFLRKYIPLIDGLVHHVPHAVNTIRNQRMGIGHFLLLCSQAHNLALVELAVVGLEEVAEML
jgi:hypothetical protein